MTRINQLQCMRSFVAVAETGSFARAAHALQLGAASVSDHIAGLERHIGVSLFHRTTRHVRLTHEGTDYLATCRLVLERLEEAERQLRVVSASTLSGVLRVEMSEGVDGFLLGAIEAFQEKNPRVTVQLLRAARQFDGATGSADVAIRSVVPLLVEERRAVSRILGIGRSTFLASPVYLERHGVPDQPAALMEHRCIGYVDPLSGRVWEWYFAEGERRFSLDVPCPLAMSQGELRRQAAADGMGIINDIAEFAAPWIRDGRLIPLLAAWTMTLPLCRLLYHRDRHPNPRTTAFIEHVEQWFTRIGERTLENLR